MRRSIQKLLFLYAIVMFCLILPACGGWIAEAQSIITLLIPAISAVLAILAAFGLGLPAGVQDKMKAWSDEAIRDLNTIKSLIEQYNAAPDADKAGILGEIRTLITVVSNNLTLILPELHVTNPQTQAQIIAVVKLVADELVALMQLVPALQGQVADHQEVAKLMAAVKKHEEFRKEFNAAVEPFGAKYRI